MTFQPGGRLAVSDDHRLTAQLAALDEAIRTVTAELSLDRVLLRIVEIATRLARARYGALGVPDGRGGLATFVTTGLTAKERARIEYLPTGKGLLGLLLRDQQPIRLKNVLDDPRSAGFCKGHPIMHSFLGVPIVGKGQIRGSLYLTEKIGAQEFSEEDEWLVTRLAAHAAIAIENAQLHAEVGRLAVLEERQRIGMDLHDGIIQSIYAVGLSLENARHTLRKDAAATEAQLAQAIEGLNEVIRDIRGYILDLRPRRFQGTELGEALRELARGFFANTLMAVQLDLEPGAEDGLTGEQRGALYHVALEALSNAARHSRASAVRLSLRQGAEDIVLAVEDNGQGFDAEAVRSAQGQGLDNMRARTRGIGGEMRLTTDQGKGTRVEVRVRPH